MRCAIIRRPVKYLCPRTIDLRAVKMKIADDILERGVQAALGPIGSDDGRLWRSTFTSGRVWQSVSVATSTRRSRDREGFRARVPAQEPIGLQTYGQRFRGGLRRLSIADIASRVTASGLRAPSMTTNRRERASRSEFAATLFSNARSSNRISRDRPAMRFRANSAGIRSMSVIAGRSA